jgi:hypothetical protein
MAILFPNDTYDANTIGSAWSSSPLGDPAFDDSDVDAIALPISRDDDRDNRAKTGPLTVFACACAIAGCAAAGAMLFASHPATTAVVPAVTISDIAPQHCAPKPGQ